MDKLKNNNTSNRNNKKILIIILSILLVIALAITGTYAWYVWQSSAEDETKLVAGVDGVYVIYNAGDHIFGQRIRPVEDKTKGIVKEITVQTDREFFVDATFNLYLDINVLDDELKHKSFRYALYDAGGQEITSGNFKEAPIIECATNDTEHIVLVSGAIINENISKYTLYIWVDGNMDNPTSMQGKNFEFVLHADGQNAIITSNAIQNEEVIPTSASSTFLNTSLKRSEIQSITIADNNIVPDVAKNTSQDISVMQNGSVMLWYTKDTNTNLYDVYIGSETGIVESNTSGEKLFAYLENVKSLDLTNFDTSNMITMKLMFNGNTGLQSLDVSDFDTSNVHSLYGMFQRCENITSLDVSNWDTGNVTLMTGMFAKCYKLSNINVTDWDTSKVTHMGGMFQECIGLLELNLKKWDVSNVTNMKVMFAGKAANVMSLVSIGNTSNWNTSKVTDMNAMFQRCANLTEIEGISNWDTGEVTDMTNMFKYCTSLAMLDLSGWKTGSVTLMDYMFDGCSNLKTVYVSDGWNTDGVVSSSTMFYGCTSIVGGAGTTYNSSIVDKTYARVDKLPNEPGYFTYKQASSM